MRQGLFPLGSTEVSTAPTIEAAQAFCAALDPDQLTLVTRPLASLDWRRWFNVHLFMYRHGLAARRPPPEPALWDRGRSAGMTPTFVGREPTVALDGLCAGTRVFESEDDTRAGAGARPRRRLAGQGGALPLDHAGPAPRGAVGVHRR